MIVAVLADVPSMAGLVGSLAVALIWGVHSVALRHWVIVPMLAATGVVWALAYRRRRSLRWPIAGHMCADLFGLSVPVLLNLHVPYPTV